MSEKTVLKMNKKLAKAMQKGDLAQIKILIDKGADINNRDADGKTPLMVSIKLGSHQMVQSFIQKGADLNVKDRFGMNAVEYAFENKNGDLMKFLLKKGCQLVEGGEDFFMIHWALGNDDREMVKLLVQNGLNLRVGTEGVANREIKETLLCHASCWGDDELISYLIDKGADVNLYNEKDITPLIYAAENGRISSVELLLKQGAQADLDINQMTALKKAEQKGHKNIVEILKKY